LKDITKKKDAERALSESEIRYRLIARATSEATWDWDIVSGKVVRSTGANGCFGFRESEIDHSFDWWRSHIHVEDRDRVLKDLNTALVSDAETIGYQYRFQKKDGSYVSILDRGFVVRDSQGKPLRALGAMMDVTERIRAEEERGMLLKIAASDLDKMRDERENRERFVSTLTHDLRTPLTAARMSAQLVLRRPTDVILAQKGLSKVIASIDRAESMIRDLLDTHRIQAGEKLILKIEACDLKDIATTVLEDLTTVYGDWFILKMPNPVEGYWDREHIRRVIENLCSNAVKYGSPREHVTVSVLLDKGVVDISVHNLGKPISLANQNTLFQPFRRVMTAETSTHKGWGLGLTLVRGVAEAHGGSVKVESSTEKGTIFSVVIPQDSRSIESQTNDPNGQ
jgi:PAS domain S-box-containing protein